MTEHYIAAQPGSAPLVPSRPTFQRIGSHDIDWSRVTRSIDRKRRLLRGPLPGPLPDWAYRETTLASFGLEGMDVSRTEIDDALTPTRHGRAFRSRQRQRLRNHIAILRMTDRCAMANAPLKAENLLRWYTSVSSGLSTCDLAGNEWERAQDVVRRITSPQLRLQAAIHEIVHLHCDLLADPMFPSFNGIIARLLLHAHLVRCGLPPVVFDRQVDLPRQIEEGHFTNRLIHLIEQSLDRLIRAPAS